MNTCSEQIVHLIYAYLDGDISRAEEQKLNEHLDTCEECKKLMNELSKPISFIRKADTITAPDQFVNGVMARLPKEKRKAGFQRWLRSHPLISAAALFFILMSASFFSGFSSDENFSVTKQPNLVVEGETVIVPEGETVEGDIVVRNGILRIEGEVDGNVTVIRGAKYMASTGVVTGTSEEIEKVFDWLWYNIKKTTKEVFPSFKKDGDEK